MPLMNPMSGFPGMPSMAGTWYNQQTGDAFVVKDNFFSDNGPVVVTQDGRQIEGSVLSDYLQISEAAMTKDQIEAYKKDFEDIIEEDILSRPFNPVSMNYDNPSSLPLSNPTQTSQPLKQSSNYDIIDKAFGNKVCPPTVSLQWEDPPTKQMELLHNIMDIPYKDIAEYIYHKYIKDDERMIAEIEKLIPQIVE